MIDCQSLFKTLNELGATDWANQLTALLPKALDGQLHGDLLRWQRVIDELPALLPSSIDLSASVRIGHQDDISAAQRDYLQASLMQLHPWRKGPFEVFGVYIDAEWRSDWKWERLKPHIASLQNRIVLDVGCGNGYHSWRMLGAGAKLILGVDPTLLSVMQFQLLKKLHGHAAVFVLPLGIEQVPMDMRLFDTVFSMGVLYHRRSPIDHLIELKGCLRSGGELVLETLVIDGDVNAVLMPRQRYAQMRNVWFLPSCDALLLWLRRCGYTNIKVCEVTKTSVEEQRSTEWMRFHSLSNFLNPLDNNLTCEGLPAPKRALITANIE